MKVSELIKELEQMDQDAEVVVPGDEDSLTNYDADVVYADTRRVGIATSHPRDEAIVVIEPASRGL